MDYEYDFVIEPPQDFYCTISHYRFISTSPFYVELETPHAVWLWNG